MEDYFGIANYAIQETKIEIARENAIDSATAVFGGRTIDEWSEATTGIESSSKSKFTINGVSYNYTVGQTWREWLNSSDNTEGYSEERSERFNSNNPYITYPWREASLHRKCSYTLLIIYRRWN